MDSFSIEILFTIFVIIFIGVAIKTVKENERGVIFRIEKFFKVVGPGIVLVLPFVDKLVKIDLNEKIPNWYNLKENELNEKVKEIIITKKYDL